MAIDGDDIFDRAIRKWERLALLDENDRQAIRALDARIEDCPAGTMLVKEGARAKHCHLLIDGYACRHKETTEGDRQIVSFHLPGDMLDLQHVLLSRADHNVQAISAVRIARIPIAEMRAITTAHPNLAEALWRDTLIDASVFREWVLNVGRRPAMARIAHMLCEFAARRDAAGLGSPERFDLPMTQEQIGDATGLTSVHVNRMLHELEKKDVIARARRHLHIRDWPALKRIGGFEPGYLHAEAP